MKEAPPRCLTPPRHIYCRQGRSSVPPAHAAEMDQTDTLLGVGHALDPAGDRTERLIELGGVLSARLCQIGSAATAAADELGDFLDEFARLEALGQVLGHRGDQV